MPAVPVSPSPAPPPTAPGGEGEDDPDERARRAVRVGTALGLCSAVGYTVANAALRDVSRPDDFEWSLWVTLCKAVPVAGLAWGLTAWRAARRKPALPPARLWPRLLAVGVLAQLGGNLLFQEALGVLGLALTVPATFTGIILCGAGLGWLALGEAVTARLGASIGLLIAATCCLSLAAPDAADAVVAQTTGAGASPGAVALSVTLALAAGCSYGTMGVVIRKTAAAGVGVAGTLAPIGLAGTLSLAAFLWWRTGAAGPPPTPQAALFPLAVAGTMNAFGFFCIASALQRIPVVRSNLLNASQAAMAGAAGVIWFGEPPTLWLLTGTGLTVVGLALLGLGGSSRRG